MTHNDQRSSLDCAVQPRCRRHRGLTLVELLVAISLTSAALGVVGLLLHTTWRAERASRLSSTSTELLARLADRLRADVHAASRADLGAVEPNEEHRRLTLAMANGRTIEYVAEAAAITRIAMLDDGTTHRDSFRLLPESTSQWGISENSGRPTISLIIRQSRGRRAADDAGPALRIEAVVGLSPRNAVLAEQ